MNNIYQIIPIGYILTISQPFQGCHKCKTSSPTLDDITFIKQIKATLFLEAVLAKKMQQSSSNLENEGNLSILKDEFWVVQ